MEPAPIPTSRDSLRVVVVDDSIDAATTLSFLLQTLDCKCAVAVDGLTSLQASRYPSPCMRTCDGDDFGIEVITFRLGMLA
jgi:CheY-like chemotaxis protein